jgi:hypothetical protein
MTGAFVLGLASPRAWALGAPGVSVPVYALDHVCSDARYPALAGAWAVGCGPSGLVDRAVYLPTGAVLELPRPAVRPGLAPGWVYASGAGGALMQLTPTAAVAIVDDVAVARDPIFAPPAVDGVHVVLQTNERLYVAMPRATAWPSWPVDPQGWDAPALAWPWVAWVDADLRVSVMDAALRTPHSVWSTAGTRARHVVSDGQRFAWVEDGDVVLCDPATGDRSRIKARTGFQAPPTLSGDRVCYEERVPDRGVQLRCNDGTTVAGATWPSLWETDLLYRKGDTPWLLVLAPS